MWFDGFVRSLLSLSPPACLGLRLSAISARIGRFTGGEGGCVDRGGVPMDYLGRLSYFGQAEAFPLSFTEKQEEALPCPT